MEPLPEHEIDYNAEPTLEALLSGSFYIVLNANDYFGPGADSVYLSFQDYGWAIPIIQLYGQNGIEAVMCYIRGAVHWRHKPNPGLLAALDKLRKLAPEIIESK